MVIILILLLPYYRVGIAGMKAPARGHTEVFSADGSVKIGEITSGGFGPTLNKPVAMGYVLYCIVYGAVQ